MPTDHSFPSSPSSSSACQLLIQPDLAPEAIDAFATWQSQAADHLSKHPGFLSSQFLRHTGNPLRWSVRLRFQNQEARAKWLTSASWDLLRSGLESQQKPNTRLICLENDEDPAEGTSTEVIVTKVKAESQDAYREWELRIRKEQNKFPGFLGSIITPPEPGQTTWTTLISFDSRAHMEAWMGSDARKKLLGELSEMVEYNMAHSVGGSFPGWVPDDPRTGKAPPNWKTALLVLIGLYPIVSLTILLINPYLAELPSSIVALIGCAIGVTLTTWATMPFFIGRLGWWLYPESPSAAVDWKGFLVLLGLLLVETVIFFFAFRYQG
jgi:antibiotic biosynthesis monooxygenase (ABM) superfamily enzyme